LGRGDIHAGRAGLGGAANDSSLVGLEENPMMASIVIAGALLILTLVVMLVTPRKGASNG